MPLEELEQVKLQLDAWKAVVQVQQHFNDIGLKVRGLAITLLTAVLGAATVALKEGTRVDVLGAGVRLGSLVLAMGLVIWMLFYFVDQIWYHRLLLGAVKQGELLEDLLKETVPGIGLTHGISAMSAYTFRFFGTKWVLHSRHKLKFFYLGVAALLLALAITSQFGVLSQKNVAPAPPPPAGRYP